MRMPKFRRADGPEDHAIVVTLWLDETGVARGDVLGRLVQEGGIFKRQAVPTQGDLTGKEAVETAILWRNGRDIAIVVIDREGLWLPEWGDLEA
jgi:hypothetical protein